MNNSTRVGLSFLRRRVLAPHWLQVLLMVAWLIVIMDLFIHYPLLPVAVALGYLILQGLSRLVRGHPIGWRKQMRNAAALQAAPNPKARTRVAWDQLRTYELWHLAFLVLITVSCLVDILGLINTP